MVMAILKLSAKPQVDVLAAAICNVNTNNTLTSLAGKVMGTKRDRYC